MKKGRQNKIVGQIGEYLVCAELGRQGYIATTFTGGVPDFDVLAIDESLKKTIPIQVKTIRGGSWQFKADKFMEISFRGKVQKVSKRIKLAYPNLICVFVKLGNKIGKDEFYLFRLRELQEILVRKYKKWLKIHGGKRPIKFDSLHCAVEPEDLKKFHDNWKIFKNSSIVFLKNRGN